MSPLQANSRGKVRGALFLALLFLALEWRLSRGFLVTHTPSSGNKESASSSSKKSQDKTTPTTTTTTTSSCRPACCVQSRRFSPASREKLWGRTCSAASPCESGPQRQPFVTRLSATATGSSSRSDIPTKANSDDTTSVATGTVVRTAFRQYDKDHSKPSSSQYTTRKDAQPDGIVVTKQGIQGDYNHYRTLALKSTPDRAVSLWTTDVLEMLHTTAGYPLVQVGDFGENISVEGVNYTFFQIGEQYQFVSTNNDNTISSNNINNDDTVLIEITERTEPCANLCKLTYINNPEWQPKQRIAACQDLIQWLNQADGLRGWYARVIQPGTIRPGDSVQHLATKTPVPQEKTS